MTLGKAFTILLHAFIGWALCGATMGIGLGITTLETTLVVHAIGAPIFFSLVTLLYVKRFNYTSPMQTAVMFVVFVVLMDFFVVALLINKSLEMFTSALGTWIPFALIFASTYVTASVVSKRTGVGGHASGTGRSR